MGDHIVEDGAFINSIVGEGTRFRGELDLNGLLRIDGDYSGVIRTPDKVLVGKNGRAECSIYAGTIVIGGVVKGNIYSSEKIIILSTGMVIGNIVTPRLIVEEGVILDGECRIAKDVNLEEFEHLESLEDRTEEPEEVPVEEVKEEYKPEPPQEQRPVILQETAYQQWNSPPQPAADRNEDEGGPAETGEQEKNTQKQDTQKQEGNTITVWNG